MIEMVCLLCMLNWHNEAAVAAMPKTLLMPLMSLVYGVRFAWEHTFCTSMHWAFPEALLPALSLCADVIREPNITPEHLKSAKLLLNQGRRSIEDDEWNLARDHLRRLHAPPPFDRGAYGCEEVVEAANPEVMLEDWANWSGHRGGRVVVAGKLDAERVVEHLQSECQRMTWSNRTLDPLVLEAPHDPVKKFVERPLARFIWCGLVRANAA